jgi:hypothetical protein
VSSDKNHTPEISGFHGSEYEDAFWDIATWHNIPEGYHFQVP